MKILFINLERRNAFHRDAIDRAISDVMLANDFVGGRFVEEFEWEFSEYCETRHAVGVASGTSALWLTLKALGIGPGDEVVTVPNSFFATASAIALTGATPVFVDVEPDTHTMDPSKLEGAITRRTKAVIPVHLFGQAARMSEICSIAKQSGLFVVEDACQAHGALYSGRRVGSLGHAACFSFYPTKNLGAIGDAGAVVTDDEELASRVRALRDHGQVEKNEHREVGFNSRMSSIQAAVLSEKLRYLDVENQKRRKVAAEYNRMLAHVPGIQLPVEREEAVHVYHLYVVAVNDRDAVSATMAQAEVGCAVHYPRPIHLQPAFQQLGHGPGSYPVAEGLAKRILSLPMQPELTAPEIAHVAGSLASAVALPA